MRQGKENATSSCQDWFRSGVHFQPMYQAKRGLKTLAITRKSSLGSKIRIEAASWRFQFGAE